MLSAVINAHSAYHFQVVCLLVSCVIFASHAKLRCKGSSDLTSRQAVYCVVMLDTRRGLHQCLVSRTGEIGSKPCLLLTIASHFSLEVFSFVMTAADTQGQITKQRLH